MLMLRQFHACPLSAHVAPGLNDLLDCLARRAGLSATPELYCVPSVTVNAFAEGIRRASAIAIADAMLRILSPREIARVVAHEVGWTAILILVFMPLMNALVQLSPSRTCSPHSAFSRLSRPQRKR